MKKLFFTFLLGIITIPVASAHGDEDNNQGPSEPGVSTQESSKNELPTPAGKQEVLHIDWPNYGSLIIDWGFNFLRNCPKEMKARAFDARSLNLSVYYNIRLGKSHFTISPGLGMGFEGYQFEKRDQQYYTLVREDSSRYTKFEDANNLLLRSKKILRSSLDIKYSDFLLEFRFNANSKYPKESFFIALGGKLSMLWGASTTIRYQEDGETKERVIYESFNLNTLRYGLHARVGWERFSVFYTHTLSNLFSKGKGPEKTTTSPGTIGLSIDLF